MIENGTRVKVNVGNRNNGAVITLLNKIGGEVVKSLEDVGSSIAYLVAYDTKHLSKIEQARRIDEENGAWLLFFKTLGKQRPKEFPGDERLYILVFEDELKPV